MNTPRTETIWENFAKSINGKISQVDSNISGFNYNNFFKIQAGQNTVLLSWGDLPEQGKGPFVNLSSAFIYPLPESVNTSLKIIPKDLLSNVFSILSSKRQSTENSRLNKKYIIYTNLKSIVKNLEPILLDFLDKNRHPDFVIFTSSEDDQHLLTIQANTLLTDRSDLDFYYQFGQALYETLNNGV